jgi:hypothetical protein
MQMFRYNVGGTDRAVRLAIGGALIFVAMILAALGNGLLSLIPALVGLLGLITATTGFCPLYVPLRISTVRRRTASV